MKKLLLAVTTVGIFLIATTRLCASPPPQSPPGLTITEFPWVPSGYNFAGGDALTAGPDGALWYGESFGNVHSPAINRLARITTSGVITEFPLPVPLNSMTSGPDGALWFTSQYDSGIWRSTTSGTMTVFNNFPDTNKVGIITGPDGALWFETQTRGEQVSRYSIVRMTTSGVVTNQYAMPAGWFDITVGPDGAFWFTASPCDPCNSIYRMTTSGVLSSYLIPWPNAFPLGITAGADGAVWFVDANTSRVGRITTSGVITGYLTPTAQADPQHITLGPDGAVWFAELTAAKIGRITPSGTITEYDVPMFPRLIITGPDGALWFTPFSQSTQIARAVVHPTEPTKPVVIVVPGFGASTLTDTAGNNQWLSCSSMVNLSNGFLGPMQYLPNGSPVLPLTPTEILMQSDSVSDTVNPYSNKSVLDCATTDIINDVVCTTGWLKCDATKIAYNTGFKSRMDIQNGIRDAAEGNVLQFNDLLASLTTNGFSPVSWPYDFRRDITTLANDLNTQIDQTSIANPGRKIALVTHSEGTLVAAAMIAQHRDKYDSGLLSHIISMGPPFNGSIDTYLYAQGWRSFTPFLSNANTKLLGQYWPSVYQLLPQWPFVTRLNAPVSPQITDVFNGTGDARLPKLPGVALVPDLNDPASLWSQINVNNLGLLHRWYAIIGQGQQTANQIVETFNIGNQTKPCLTIDQEDGDGTVPLRSSQAGSIVPGANQIYVIDKHTHLPRNTDVINGIVNILSGVSPFTGTSLSASPKSFAPGDVILLNSCSPVNLTVTDSSGNLINAQVSQIPNATFANIADATQITLPWNDTFQVQIVGTGTGTFDLLVNGLGGQHAPLSYVFKGVPVLTGSRGAVVIGGASIPALQYNYAGKIVIDTIPANTTPPTVLCTGCYFTIQTLRATLAFNVGYLGGVSTFSYNYRSSSQAVQFISTTTSQISVSGNSATFSGLGTLNGQAGYSFAVTAKDGGPAGSGLDSVTVLITGPNNYSYSVSSAIVGGDVVVHP